MSEIADLVFSLQLNEMIRNPGEGHFWQVDHIKPVSSGGGQCSLDNLQTLCTICHKEVSEVHRHVWLHPGTSHCKLCVPVWKIMWMDPYPWSGIRDSSPNPWVSSWGQCKFSVTGGRETASLLIHSRTGEFSPPPRTKWIQLTYCTVWKRPGPSNQKFGELGPWHMFVSTAKYVLKYLRTLINYL